MNKLDFKSILNTNRNNRNTKSINTNTNCDLATTLNMASKKGISKNKKNLELKTKVEKYQKSDNNPYNTISSLATPNFSKENAPNDQIRFKGHKKNISEVPVNHIDMLIDNKIFKYDDKEALKVFFI
jgi:hypothetical protein